MSISNIQLKAKTEEIEKELLALGIEPNNYEVNKRLHEFFDQKTIGMPYYAPIKQTPYEVSSSADYNHNFETLEQDIKTAYTADIEASVRMAATQEHYDTEKNNLKNSLAKLCLRTENLREAIKHNAGGLQQFVEVFNNYYDIEYYGDAKRNIPYTTSFVDLLQKKVYTEKTNPKVNKISMKNASISVSGYNNFSDYTTTGNEAYILDDTMDKVYLISGTTSSEKSITIDLTIDLGTLTTLNTVFFEFISMRELTCSLSLSDDGENYIPVYDNDARDFIEWNFNIKKVRYLKIQCTKSEPDGINDSLFEYYFLLKNISIADESFEEKSVFVSKPIEFEELTSTIKLDATDKIFNNTSISYFIGFDNKTGKIGWDNIKNHKDYELFMFEKANKILNSSVDEFAAKTEGVNLYKIYRLPDGVNKNSIKLTPGYHAWSVTRYDRKEAETSNDSLDLNNMDYTEHANKCTKTQLFMDCENYKSFSVNGKQLYIFTQYVKLDTKMQVQNKTICLMDTTLTDKKDAQVRVFINGYETSATNGKYSFSLKKGVSKIQIAFYGSEPGILYHNLNLKQVTDDVFAMPPMKYLNEAILATQMKESYSYYTIKNNYLCVNVNPQDILKNELEDMGYFLTYSCLKNDLKKYFENNKIRFRIMAVLTSNDRSLSPEILNYRVTGR